MRKNIVHPGAKELSYEIREIVEVAQKVKSYWIDIKWENIWDPVKKWEKIPDWIKNIISKSCQDDNVYAYAHTKWLEKTREFLAKCNSKTTKEDIIFFNWLGDAISSIYKNLRFDARIIWPNPAYSTHSSAEWAHAGSDHISYRLDPDNNWNPNLKELENKVKYNPQIVGILVINPDNPTWAVFKKEVLEKIVNIAKKYDLFLIFDEVYEKFVFNPKDKVLLADIIWDVPGIAMRSMSKDIPWPWARCGRIEVYNKEKDANFSAYIDSIFKSKMLEVSSTTLPQEVLPEIYTHEKFENYRLSRIEKYIHRAKIISEILSDIKCISFIEPKWAFYSAITFEKYNPNSKLSLEINNLDLKNYIDSLLLNSRLDKKFCYHLLASTGICIVPLSGFNSTYDGFRITLLEQDMNKFRENIWIIKEALLEFFS